MTMNPTAARARGSALTFALLGLLFVAAAIFASLSARNWIVAGLAGATGLALWRRALLGDWSAAPIPFDAAAFAIFAIQRNDSLGFWQLAGPWADVPRFDVPDAAIAYGVYLGGALAALIGAYRALRPIEAIGLVAIPFLFKLGITLGADWHMAELGALATAGFVTSFQAQVFIGRALVLFFISEVGLEILSLTGVGRLARMRKLHVLILAIALYGALTPLLANFAQSVAAPVAAIGFGALFAALTQAGLWGMVYFATGLALDALVGRPPSFASVHGHWRSGFVKGAIYGGMFMLLVLAVAAPLRDPGFVAFLKGNAHLVAPAAGALAFPFAQDPHRQLGRNAAVLRAPHRRISRPARLGARRRRRHGRRLGLRHRLRSRERQFCASARRSPSAPSPTRASTCSSTRRASSPANGARCRPGASMRSASRSAASWRARSAGISTRRRSPSW